MHRQAPGPYAPSRGYKNLRVEDPPTYFVKNRNGNRVNCWEPDPQAIPVEYSNSQNYFPKVNSPYGNAGYKSRSVNGQVTSRNYGEPLRSPNYQGYNKNKMFPWTNWKVKETSDALDRTGWVPRSSSPQKVYRKGYQDKNRGITSASKNLAPETNSNLVSIHGNENKMEVDPKEIQEHEEWKHLRKLEKAYDVNLVTTDMPPYEPLVDEYLQDYFNSSSIRSHLYQLGIVSKDGLIIDPKSFKHAQLVLDRMERERRMKEEAEKRDFDREVEVAIRKAIENVRHGELKKLRGTEGNSMEKTIQLYSHSGTRSRSSHKAHRSADPHKKITETGERETISPTKSLSAHPSSPRPFTAHPKLQDRKTHTEDTVNTNTKANSEEEIDYEEDPVHAFYDDSDLVFEKYEENGKSEGQDVNESEMKIQPLSTLPEEKNANGNLVYSFHKCDSNPSLLPKSVSTPSLPLLFYELPPEVYDAFYRKKPEVNNTECQTVEFHTLCEKCEKMEKAETISNENKSKAELLSKLSELKESMVQPNVTQCDTTTSTSDLDTKNHSSLEKIDLENVESQLSQAYAYLELKDFEKVSKTANEVINELKNNAQSQIHDTSIIHRLLSRAFLCLANAENLLNHAEECKRFTLLSFQHGFSSDESLQEILEFKYKVFAESKIQKTSSEDSSLSHQDVDFSDFSSTERVLLDHIRQLSGTQFRRITEELQSAKKQWKEKNSETAKKKEKEETKNQKRPQLSSAKKIKNTTQRRTSTPNATYIPPKDSTNIHSSASLNLSSRNETVSRSQHALHSAVESAFDLNEELKKSIHRLQQDSKDQISGKGKPTSSMSISKNSFQESLDENYEFDAEECRDSKNNSLEPSPSVIKKEKVDNKKEHAKYTDHVKNEPTFPLSPKLISDIENKNGLNELNISTVDSKNPQQIEKFQKTYLFEANDLQGPRKQDNLVADVGYSTDFNVHVVSDNQVTEKENTDSQGIVTIIPELNNAEPVACETTVTDHADIEVHDVSDSQVTEKENTDSQGIVAIIPELNIVEPVALETLGTRANPFQSNMEVNGSISISSPMTPKKNAPPYPFTSSDENYSVEVFEEGTSPKLKGASRSNLLNFPQELLNLNDASSILTDESSPISLEESAEIFRRSFSEVHRKPSSKELFDKIRFEEWLNNEVVNNDLYQEYDLQSKMGPHILQEKEESKENSVLSPVTEQHTSTHAESSDLSHSNKSDMWSSISSIFRIPFFHHSENNDNIEPHMIPLPKDEPNELEGEEFAQLLTQSQEVMPGICIPEVNIVSFVQESTTVSAAESHLTSNVEIEPHMIPLPKDEPNELEEEEFAQLLTQGQEVMPGICIPEVNIVSFIQESTTVSAAESHLTSNVEIEPHMIPLPKDEPNELEEEEFAQLLTQGQEVMPQLNKEESNDSFMVHVSSIEKFFKVENEMEENERKPIGVFANKSVLNPIGDCSNNSHDLVRKVGKEMVQHSISENGIIEQPYAPQLNLNADKNEKLSGKRFTPLEPLPDLKHDFQSVTSSFRVKMVENGMERKEVFDPKTGLVHIVESAPINLNSSHIGHDQHSTQHSTDISAPKSVIENKPTHLSNADNSSSELLSTWLDDEDDAFLASLPMPPSAGHSVTGQKSLFNFTLNKSSLNEQMDVPLPPSNHGSKNSLRKKSREVSVSSEAMNVPLPPSNHGSKNSLRKKSREVSTSSEAMNVPLPPSHLGSKDSFQNKSHENTSKHFIIQERHIPKSFNKPRTDLPRPPNYYNQPLRDSKPQVHVKDQTQGYSKKYNRTKSQDHLWHPDLPQKPVKNFSVNEKTFQKIPWKSETALLNESVNFSPSNEQGGKSKGI